MSLNNKQRMFLDRYLTHFNATKAAEEVGYSPRTARQQGSRLLSNADIKASIDERIMSADQAASLLSDIADGDLADLMDITTSGFTLNLMKKNEAGELIVKPETKLIKKIKQKVTTYLAKKEDEEDREIVETELELYSAHEAQKDILKYRGKLIDRTDLTTNGKELPAATVNVYIPDNNRENNDRGSD